MGCWPLMGPVLVPSGDGVCSTTSDFIRVMTHVGELLCMLPIVSDFSLGLTAGISRLLIVTTCAPLLPGEF